MDTWTAPLAAGDLVAARMGLRAAFEAGEAPPAQLARAAEEAGDAMLAVRAWQLVLRDHPDHAGAWESLGGLYELLGDRTRSAECRRRAGATGEEAADPAPEVPTEGAEGFADADLVRFCALFAGREGVHARMWKNAEGHGYGPVERTLTPELLRVHLAGEETLGVYLVRVDDSVTCCCFDLDVTRRALEQVVGDAVATRTLRAELGAAGLDLLGRLRALGLDPLYVDSGWKGRHYWCFLPSPQPASMVLAWGTAVVAGVRPTSARLALEFFPKQSKVGPGGLGNLVKLPLGLHLVSQRRAVLLDDDGKPHADPWSRLRSVRRCTLPSPPSALPAAPTAGDSAPFAPAPGPLDWTEADFEASPQVGPVFRGCAVIRRIVEQALKDRRITHDERVVLEHSLGHLPDGVRAVNYVLGRVPNLAADQRMQTPHSGSPISCARARQRAPDHARAVGCDCPLQPRPGGYANPLLHAVDAAPGPVEPSLDDGFEQLARAEDRLRTVQAEVRGLRAGLAARMAKVPGGRWAARGGEWVLGDEEGMATLRWIGG